MRVLSVGTEKAVTRVSLGPPAVDVRGEAVGEVVEDPLQSGVVGLGRVGEVEVPHVGAAFAPGGVAAGVALLDHAGREDMLAAGDAGPDDFRGELAFAVADLRAEGAPGAWELTDDLLPGRFVDVPVVQGDGSVWSGHGSEHTLGLRCG